MMMIFFPKLENKVLWQKFSVGGSRTLSWSLVQGSTAYLLISFTCLFPATETERKEWEDSWLLHQVPSCSSSPVKIHYLPFQLAFFPFNLFLSSLPSSSLNILLTLSRYGQLGSETLSKKTIRDTDSLQVHPSLLPTSLPPTSRPPSPPSPPSPSTRWQSPPSPRSAPAPAPAKTSYPLWKGVGAACDLPESFKKTNSGTTCS